MTIKTSLALLILLVLTSLSYAQTDGIYVSPQLNNTYALQVTYGDLARIYAFKLDNANPWWSRWEGYNNGGSVELSTSSFDIIEGIQVSGSDLGLATTGLYCNTTSEEYEGKCDGLESDATFIPVLKATSAFKAIYRTQWGAELAIFESNGLAVGIIFEKNGEDTAPTGAYYYVGAFRAKISDEYLLSKFKLIVETDADGDDDISFEIKINDLSTMQAEFVNVTCISGKTDKCNYLEENYFSKLIRIF